MRGGGALAVVLVVLIAGCGGNLGTTPTPESTPTATEPSTASSTPTVTENPTPTATPTATPDPAVQNPWRQETVGVTLLFEGAVDNETRHRRFLREAITFWNGRTAEYTAHRVRFELVDSVADAQVTITVRPTISECGGQTADTSFGYCTDTYEADERATATEARVAARYDDEPTRTHYRALFGTMLGMDDAERVPGVTFVDDPDLRDPWPESNPVVVGVSNQVNESRTFTPLVQRALAYWESGEGAPHKNYSVDFVLRPDAEDPDVTVRFVGQLLECGDNPVDPGYVGCANVYSGDDPAADESVVRILGGYTDESTYQTLVHEFGHLHGRLHGQEPLPEMAASSDAVRLPQPDARDRDEPWKYDRLRVYLDLSNLSVSTQDVWKQEIVDGLEYVDSGAEGAVPGNVGYTFVTNRSEADVVVTAVETDEFASSGDFFGENTDADEALERYTFERIVIGTDTPARDVAFHVAYWLALGWTEPDELPPTLDPDNDRSEPDLRERALCGPMRVAPPR